MSASAAPPRPESAPTPGRRIATLRSQSAVSLGLLLAMSALAVPIGWSYADKVLQSTDQAARFQARTELLLHEHDDAIADLADRLERISDGVHRLELRFGTLPAAAPTSDLADRFTRQPQPRRESHRSEP